MDDYLDSAKSPDKAINRSKELVHLPYLGGFKLAKFVTNVPNLADQNDGPPQSTDPKVIVSCWEDSSHVLGLNRHHNNDILFLSWGSSCTLNNLLSQPVVQRFVSKVFDTIGFVATFTACARLHLKDIFCVTRQRCDDELFQIKFQSFLL